MYYEKQILPIDTEGNFLLAVHYPRHKIGGEITRESRHAYFAYGNADHLETLKEITSLCCLPRKPSSEEEGRHQSISEVQQDLAEQHRDTISLQKQYQKTAWEYGYQAKLARHNSEYVPRTVIASLNGILALGLEIEEESGWGSSAILRFIDIFGEKILAEHSESQGPKSQAICYPHAIAVDGKTLLMTEAPSLLKSLKRNNDIIFVERSIPKLKAGVRVKQPMPMATFCATYGMWIAIDDNVYLIESGTSKLINTLPLPKGAINWTVEIASENQTIAFASDKGQISLLDLNTGKVKKFFPHRGCKRDDLAEIKLSADGDWMASKIGRQKELMVTRLNDGLSWCAGELNDGVIDEKVEGEFRSQSQIPAAFSFIGSRLLVSDSREVRELVINEPLDKKAIFVSEQGKPGARVPIKIPAKATFDKLIKAAKLERLSDEIKNHYSPAVKIRTKKSKKSGWLMPDKKGAPDLAVSRFGGWPDLPKGVDWPMWQDRPMCFLAQINLEDVYASQPDARLPKHGLLLFFLGCSDEIYDNDAGQRETYMADPMLGVDSIHKDAWKVIFAESNTPLQRTTFEGDSAPDMFAPCLLGISRGGMILPDENTAAYENIPFNQIERDNYNEIVDLLSSDDWQNQLMGYPNLIQFTPPDMQCELASTGNDPYSFPLEDSDEYKNLIQDASDWGLLLQLTSDDNPNFVWGDEGNLYFYGKRSEMESGDFSNIWINFECH